MIWVILQKTTVLDYTETEIVWADVNEEFARDELDRLEKAHKNENGVIFCLYRCERGHIVCA